jgi:hypothetical protein
MFRVVYLDPEIDRSFEHICNSEDQAKAYLAARECEGCEGFIEQELVSHG